MCFFVSFLTLPLIALRPTKFALSFSLGSLLVMFGCVPPAIYHHLINTIILTLRLLLLQVLSPDRAS